MTMTELVIEMRRNDEEAIPFIVNWNKKIRKRPVITMRWNDKEPIPYLETG
jgi:hypothetical protein